MFSLSKIKKLLLQFLKLMLIFFPFTYAATRLKEGTFRHGDEFYVLNLEAALLLAAGLALLVALWNALEYGRHSKIDEQQYLSPKQVYDVNLGDKTLEEIEQSLANRLLTRKRWIQVRKNESSLELAYRFYLNNWDKLIIEKRANGWRMTSMPYRKFWFVDLGRNYKHIVNVSKELLD